MKTVDIHLAPETMNFGVAPLTDDSINKTLRGENNQNVTVPLRNNVGVIDIAGLVAKIKSLPNVGDYTSAQFAFDMIEGVQKVRFVSA